MHKIKAYTITTLLVLALIAGAFYFHSYVKERSLHILPYGFKKFSLTDPAPACARWKEHMPKLRDPSAYHLYIEARKVWRSKIEWQLTREEAVRILADVRKAAELGDWGARALMAHFYLEGLGPLPSNNVQNQDAYKAVAIARMAAEAGQPWGLYDLGVAYEYGYGGAHYDENLAWAYYLRAAQLGSPDGQMALAKAYDDAGRSNDGAAMLQCAFRQGHGPAAYELGLRAGVEERFSESFRYFQEGVKFGSRECARDLEHLFRQGFWGRGDDKETSVLKSLGVGLDLERERRYQAIHDALQINPDLKLSKLDIALPFPPAKLPEWSGVDAVVDDEPDGPPTY